LCMIAPLSCREVQLQGHAQSIVPYAMRAPKQGSQLP
jgi:hypothetical protein